MANVISDETIEYVGILAKLELSDAEKEAAKKDMASMLDYIDMLNELDTTGVEPMSHVFPVHNVFREDVVVNGDDRNNMLKNAPAVKDGSYKIQRPFVLVTRTDKTLSEAAQKFVDYALSAEAAEIIAMAGAVAAN